MEENKQQPKTMIRVKNLRKEYRLEDDTVVALKRINLEIKQGEICCIFGTSGSGFVFQSYNLLPFMTAIENVAMPLMFRGESKRKRTKKAVAILKKVGLGNRLKHYPRQMSGGQQQRVGIARAFVAKPDVVFADEPTGNLDSKTTIEVMEMIKSFARRFNQTIVLVTHDPEMAQYADRIITLVDGRIVKETINNNEGEQHEQAI